MPNAPLNLDWNVLLRSGDDAPPPEVLLDASRGGGGGRGEEASALSGRLELSALSDHELQGKIRRMTVHVKSGLKDKLSDRGEKLRSSLRQLEDERDRRKIARFTKDTGEGCPTKSNVKRLFDISNEFYSATAPCLSHLKSSFPFILSNKSECKGKSAFNKELDLITGDKSRNLTPSGIQGKRVIHPLERSSRMDEMSSMEFSVRCVASEIKQGLSSGGFRDAYSNYTPRRNSSKHFHKRRMVSEPLDSSELGNKRRISELLGSSVPENKVHEVVSLDDEDEKQLVQEDMLDKWKEFQIFYPSRDDPESVELTYSDIECLDPKSYLSSPIMNFYIQYIQRSLSPLNRPREQYYVFNTYFYKKLEDAMSQKDSSFSRFLKLRRWWKGVNIFQKAYIFLPVHGNLHWSLVIICVPAIEEETGPIILHLDSLDLHDSNPIFNTVYRYLKEEWNYINQNDLPSNLPFAAKIWDNLPHKILKEKLRVPQQENVYDCGLFVLYFIERFIREVPERLKRRDIDMFGRDWFRPEEASGLRQRIRELLIEEYESSRLDISPARSATSAENSESDNEYS